MKLTVLGSGSSVPHPKRSGSGFFVDASGGTALLDCSPSSVQRMADEGLDWTALDAIWISHFHIDHFGGLAPLLAGIKHAPQARDRAKPLRIFGGVGLRQLLEAWDAAGEYHLLEQVFPVEIVEITPLVPFMLLANCEAVAMRTPHTDTSHALHIRDGETTLVYTSDTGPDPSIAALANGVDLLLMECTFVRNKPVAKHLELAEAMHIIRKAHPKRAMLTHFHPEWDTVNFSLEIAKFDPTCEVVEAVDGLVVTI